LDLHTGLGPYGHAELMCNGRGPGWPARLRAVFGEACTGEERAVGAGGGNSGPLAAAVWEEVPEQAELLSMVVEWGTYSSDRVLAGHRLDNWLHFGASEDERAGRRAAVAAVMKENLCPSDPDWRALVLLKSEHIFGRATSHLGGGPRL
jgi:hypothetical protein